MATQRATDRTRSTRTIVLLVESGILADGTQLTLRPFEAAPSVREQVLAWAAEDPSRGQAEWVIDPVHPLRWRHDGRQYAPTTLVKEIIERATGTRPTHARGPRWWVNDQGRDLAELTNDEPAETNNS